MSMLGQRVKRLRERKGWSQSELARQSGGTQATISRLESGALLDVQTQLASRLARALGVSLDYLAATFEEDEDGELHVLVSVK